MNCIGLKDKNGRLVMLGDHIKFRYIEKFPLGTEMDHGERVGVLKFKNYGWVLESEGMNFHVGWVTHGEVL